MSSATTGKPEMIRVEHISKRFGGVNALRNVSVAIAKGEIHALVGENGAGKSTLMKIMAGIYQPDSGQIFLRNEPVSLNSPLQARQAGVSIVSQELALFPHLSITANIFANREKSTAGVLNKRKMSEEARQVLTDMGVHLDPSRTVGSLAVGERQLVEIARTFHQKSDIIIMDEPNSALNAYEFGRLFEILRGLRDRGLDHHLTSRTASRKYSRFATGSLSFVMANTRAPGRPAKPPFQRSSPRWLAGGSRNCSLPAVHCRATHLPSSASRILPPKPALKDVSFELRAGEILGFAGLEGSGIDDIFDVLFGLRTATSGSIAYSDGRPAPASPFRRSNRGSPWCRANRRDEGLLTSWSIRYNASLPVLDRLLFALGVIDRKAEGKMARDYVKRLNIVTDSVDKRVVNLSGGNQQKVVLAKWMATGPTVLLLNDPTRGVDVGAKAEIYHLCAELAAGGMALLFTSSEIEETIGLCDRVRIMFRGNSICEFQKGEATKVDVALWVSGGDNTSLH